MARGPSTTFTPGQELAAGFIKGLLEQKDVDPNYYRGIRGPARMEELLKQQKISLLEEPLQRALTALRTMATERRRHLLERVLERFFNAT